MYKAWLVSFVPLCQKLFVSVARGKRGFFPLKDPMGRICPSYVFQFTKRFRSFNFDCKEGLKEMREYSTVSKHTEKERSKKRSRLHGKTFFVRFLSWIDQPNRPFCELLLEDFSSDRPREKGVLWHYWAVAVMQPKQKRKGRNKKSKKAPFRALSAYRGFLQMAHKITAEWPYVCKRRRAYLE